MADKDVDFGIEGSVDNAVLIDQDQLGSKQRVNDDDLDRLAADLDLEPVGKPMTGRKGTADETLANDQSIDKQLLVGNTSGAKVVGGDSAVILANSRPAREVNIKKVSPDSGGQGNSNYVSRKMKQFDDTDSGAEQTDQEDGSIAMKDNRGNDIKQLPNMRFKNYKSVFTNLIKYRNVATAYPIITMMISYDSTRALTVTKAAENRSILKMYSLKDYEITFHEELGLGENDYIKCKEMEQTDDGNQFACVYFNDGVFFLRTFGKEKRTEEEIAANELNINELLNLEASTMPCQDLADPFITCCWVGMDKVYVALFHGGTMTHYHFLWDVNERKLIGMNDATLGEQAVSHKMHGSSQNFPFKSFYSEEKDEIYTFYRQGQAFTMKPTDLENFRFEQMIDKDLDQMVLLYGKALIVRSSSSVLFFKQVYDKVTEEWSWTQYNEINVRGLIYYIKGNIRIQVTTEEYIYFYLIDKETFEPELENLMYNYMKCTQCMFGKRVRYGITYKNNERGFDVYQRKYMHNLKVKVHGQNLEGSKAVEVKSMGKFLVTEVDKVQMYDSYTFEKVGDPLPIKLLPTETREANEVIGIQVSQCEQYVAVVTGKNLVKNEQKQNQVQMMKRVRHPSGNEDEDTWELYRRIVVKDMPLFNKVVMQFYFKKAPPGEEPHSLIFAKKDIIFELNFQMQPGEDDDKRITTIHTMASFCKLQPQYFVTNATQDIFVVSSQSDGLYINLRGGEGGLEIDIDQAFDITDIKSLIYDQDEQMFYLLANRNSGIIGFFLMRFPVEDPHKVERLTMWKHNLDIDNASMFISKGNNERQKYRELIIGYKTIFINTYTVAVKDLSDPKGHGAVLYKHESFQLWESLASGLLTNFNKDYISFTSQGMNVLALGELRNGKRELKDFEGQPKMIHSLDAYKYLKIDKENYINYQCQYYSNRVISIEHEWTKTSTNAKGELERETKYYDIYKVKIHEITLREIMILQAIYLCKTQNEICNLVKKQPNPKFFYKSFLEFDGANLLSMLAFDSGSIEALLHEDNEQYFDPLYPVIYKNKITKKSGKGEYLSSAIDNALRANQVKAVSLIIDYIIKFQNNYTSSFLFIKNFPVLMEKGIEVTALLESSIFNVSFDFDDWPGSHPNEEKSIQPYNGSYFDIRLMYLQVFDGEEFAPDAASKTKDKSKIYKMKYSVNLLGQCGMYVEEDENQEINVKNEEVNLMSLCEETEEMSIFDTSAIGDIIEYRWDTYAMNFHLFGLFMNVFYIISFILYVKEGYIEADSEHQKKYLLVMNIGLVYPVCYEITQLIKTGFFDYISSNKVDVVYYVAGITNIVLQYMPDQGFGPRSMTCQVLMCYLVVNLIIKTFFYLRIFDSMTGIVVMLTNVIFDLRAFMLFYVILLWLSSHMFMVIGLGNNLPPLDEVLAAEEAAHGSDHRMLKSGKSSSTGNTENAEQIDGIESPVEGTEYVHIGLYLGTVLSTARISIGDFSAIDTSADLENTADNIMFWIIWVFVMGATCIVFLNFIVAEASASYAVVMDTLDQVIQQEKAALIAEADGLSMNTTKEKYPKYLITREKDE